MKIQANTDVVLEFIDNAYNVFRRDGIKDLVHEQCHFQYGEGFTAQSLYELQGYLKHMKINTERLYDRLEYQISEIIQHGDIVSVLIVKQGIPSEAFTGERSAPHPIEMKQWEMFHIEHGKIKTRWTAGA